MNLSFGLSSAVPDTVTTAWGARWIFPDDMLWDRQSNAGPGWEPLKEWLNGRVGTDSPIGRARKAAARAASHYQITPDSRDRVILHLDNIGVIVGSPNASYGYLYVAAWLHHGAADRMPAYDFRPAMPAKGKLPNRTPKRKKA